MVNLRAMMESLGGTAGQTRNADNIPTATFMARNAAGEMTIISLREGVITVNVGGAIVPAGSVNREFIADSWYVPMASFGILFGYMPQLDAVGNLQLF